MLKSISFVNITGWTENIYFERTIVLVILIEQYFFLIIELY